MPIELSKPAITPKTEEIQYTHAWFPRILIDAPDPNADAEVHVDVVPFRLLEGGTRELMPNSRRRIHVERLFESSEFDEKQIEAISQILSAATTAQKLALAQVAMYAALEAKGKELGVI